ncbi:MAG: DUF3536 domain-containing protein [Myxococcaceae bacterium]|nr:DUF3536 domain-containing protein [Myxococcaceae bacterium]
MTTRRLLCLHGHFYQPPRDNPWLDTVEVQDSAYPFHDWNARIAAECYEPNGAARIKTADGRIRDIVNNYERISFNVGPTLLSWLERERPKAYERILEADRASLRRCGHGNALAQGYSHSILPLCSPRDRRTQIRWGIADFRHRFQRPPEGFWLPELAVDLDTLRDLAREGIRFVVLSPYQARRLRAPDGDWFDVEGGRFDPSRPYRLNLGGDLSLAAFFYDGPIARALAFDGALKSPDALISALRLGFDARRGHDEVLTIAIDGETFGHHKKGADEVLAQALHQIDESDEFELVNLGEALDRLPLDWEAEIIEGSSWSCVHGLERWRGDCGCQSAGQVGWHQRWRAPLREALDQLRGHLDEIYEREARAIFVDPWQARDQAIGLVLDPTRSSQNALITRLAGRVLDPKERVRAFTLLDMERQALLMYSSCGWFFSELSGIETVQNLRYAARAIELAESLTGVDLEPIFRGALRRAESNLAQFGDGDGVFEQCVLPSRVPIESVAAHFAIASLFDTPAEEGLCLGHRYALSLCRRESLGGATLALGHLELESCRTAEQIDVSFVVLHFGGSDFRLGLTPFASPGAHSELSDRLLSTFGRGQIAPLLRDIDKLFPGRDYTLRDLFLDERRRMASLLLGDAMGRYENLYQGVFETNRRLMELLREIDSPIPLPLCVAADRSLSHQFEELVRRLEEGRVERAKAHAEFTQLKRTAEKLGVSPDLSPLKPAFDRMLRREMDRLGGYQSADAVFELTELIELTQRLGLHLDLSAVQNQLWALVASNAGGLDRDQIVRLAQKLWFEPQALENRAQRAASAPLAV